MNRKIVIYNPHIDDFFAKPLHFHLLKRRALKKYGFILNKNINNQIYIYNDYTQTSFINEKYFKLFPNILKKIICYFEFFIWKKINGLDADFHNYKLNSSTKDDIIISMSYKSVLFLNREKINFFESFKFSVFHLSHYFIDTNIKSTSLSKINNVYLAGDSDILENDYFKHYFNWYKKKFLILPFSVSDRFKLKIKFKSKTSKAIATGSFHDLSKEVPAKRYQDFISYTGLNSYHPIRVKINDNSKILHNQVKNLTSPYRDYSKSSLLKFIDHFKISQKKYFKIDIVEEYNKHKYAIVGEERSGFPALGSFEAMACGCVLIGDKNCYRGLGLIEDLHFKSHNGDIENIKKIILKNDEKEAARISKNAVKFIKDNFSDEAVYNLWIKNIDSL